MGDRLPVDVLLSILDDELSGFAHGHDEYRDRQQTLRSVCLASRRLRALAQPLLWRQVAIRRRDHWDHLVASPAVSRLGQHARRYEVAIGAGTLAFDESVDVADKLPNIVDMRLMDRAPPVNLLLFERHTHLRRLYLGFLIIDQGAPVPCLPQLEELYIRRSALSLDMAKEWLQAERLPALLVLHCVGVQDPATGQALALADALSSDLLPQLDLVQTTPQHLSPRDPLAQGIVPPVLLFSPVALDALPRHSLWQPVHFAKKATAVLFLRKLLTLLDGATRPDPAEPRFVLFLPSKLRALATQHTDVASGVQVLEELARAKDVRVRWTSESLEADLVSREFWQYARGVKAARDGA